MKRAHNVAIALCVMTWILPAQPAPSTGSLESKVRGELGVVYRDNPGPGGAIEVRLRKLGDQKAIAGILIDLINKSTDLIDEDFRPGSPDPDRRYWNLTIAISALGKLKESDAISVLTMVAKRATRTSELEVLAILSISEIDPAGSIPLLVDALHNPQYVVRLSAAEGLSKTNDPSMVYELNVAASRESNRDCRLEIQALADAMQARLRSEPKAPR